MICGLTYNLGCISWLMQLDCIIPNKSFSCWSFVISGGNKICIWLVPVGRKFSKKFLGCFRLPNTLQFRKKALKAWFLRYNYFQWFVCRYNHQHLCICNWINGSAWNDHCFILEWTYNLILIFYEMWRPFLYIFSSSFLLLYFYLCLYTTNKLGCNF